MNKKVLLFGTIFIFGILLMLIMPNKVSAADVNSISMTMNEPTLNGTPATSASVGTISPNWGWTRTIQITGWQEKRTGTESSWVDMTTSTFKAGYSYLPVFQTWRNYGQNYSIGEESLVTINDTILGTWGEFKGFAIEYKKVSELNLTVTEPVVGEHPDTTFKATSVPDEALVSEDVHYNWYEGDTNNKEDFDLSIPISTEDVFKVDKYYLVSISKNILDEDYTIADDTIITLNGKKVEKVDYAIYGPLTRDYTITFNSNGGKGAMDPIVIGKGLFTLPENKFTAPAEKQFRGWSLSENGEIISSLQVNDDITVYAIWEDVPKEEKQEEKKTNNPKTGDTIIVSIVTLGISLIIISIVTKKYIENK